MVRGQRQGPTRFLSHLRVVPVLASTGGEDTISFALGAVDNPTGVTLEKHIFAADRGGDYYDIADGLPQSR